MKARTASRLAVLAAAFTVLALALVAAGCGSSNDSSSSGGGGAYGGGGSTKPTSTSSAGSGVVAVTSNPKLGKILTDSQGNTLYYFEKDKQNGGSSTCSGACAQVWPPYTTSGSPKSQNGASASKLGTIKRSDGTTEVTYNGWPLYTYAGDKAPGEANGNDFSQFGAQWYALTPAGDKPAEG